MSIFPGRWRSLEKRAPKRTRAPTRRCASGSRHAYRREGKLDAGARVIAEAMARYRMLEDDEGLAEALHEAAAIALFQGSTKKALAYFDEGLVLARRAAAPLLVGTFMTARASALQGLGEQATDEAVTEHAAAAALFRELGSRSSEASALSYLGTAHLECGELPAATAAFRAARERVRGLGSPHYEALIESGLALALCLGDHLDECAFALSRSEAAAAKCATEPALGAAVRIHGASLALHALARTANPAELETARAAAIHEADTLTTAHSNDDSHFARRMLLVTAKAAPSMSRRVLLAAKDGSSFRPPGSRDTVDLSTRPLL